jgi:hypothetical protein
MEYKDYRPCLRWEFGFLCSYCFSPEGALASSPGAKGGYVFSIEHRIPRSEDKTLINTYTNCYYACSFCNNRRRTTKLNGPNGERLLDPCYSPWSEHFETRTTADGKVHLDHKTPHGKYTKDSCELNLDRKTIARGLQALLHADWADASEAHEEALGELQSNLSADAPRARVEELWKKEQRAYRMSLSAAQRLRRLMIPPTDAGNSCLCPGATQPALPPNIETVELHLP